ncbi:hypothetical protein MAMP_01142 [Methylophaga aminisulfidivorans MP]|uniref:Uncharacterized protein n=1 Tax=Methylophaga aminisulfidivorans MP TaxID=1026882 RepID=F5SZQ6_9GAMM|nr:hypothetical protein [Methylophaga aminisulfidivorans]EGL54483.1 hypothetical protein MAMP_01142 [Methylophaga aminisulfidivorans MP]
MANSPSTSHSITSPNSSEPITVKSSTCKSLSGKSDLTYHIACDSDNEIYFRIADNSGNGFFSCEWVKLSDIEAVFDSMKKGEGITSFHLDSLFIGKSVNTPAFLLAVLKAEGLIKPQPLRQRAHDRLPSKDFQERIFALVDADVNIDAVKKSSKNSSKSTRQPKS